MSRKEYKIFRKKDDREEVAFSLASKEITLTEAVNNSLSYNVREWKAADAQLWLQDVFAESEELPNYLASFKKLGVRGVDLLVAGDDVIQEFGIKTPTHIKRMKTCIAQLLERQKQFDEDSSEKKTKKAYNDLLEQYNEMTQSQTPYTMPLNFAEWKCFDIFKFLKDHEDSKRFDEIVEHIAMKSIRGGELLSCISGDKLTLTGLKVDANTEKLFIKTIQFQEARMKTLLASKRAERKAIFTHGFPPIEENLLCTKEKIGSGSFGTAYFAEYKKRKVVVKTLRLDSTDKSQEEKDAVNDDNYISALIYEVHMMHRAAGLGVIKLVAVDPAKSRFIMEYAAKKSVWDQLELTKKDDPSSIFHPSNERNKIDQEEYGTSEPTFLQVVRIARDVAGALARLHKIGIVHLDIAARNILLDAYNRPKIGDFGLARLKDDLQEDYRLFEEQFKKNGGEYKEAKAFVIENNPHCFLNMQIPVLYLPNWVFYDNPKVDDHVDVYSFGCFMLEMVQKKGPHFNESVNDVKTRKMYGIYHPIIPSGTHTTFAGIITSCWAEYEKQPTMENLAIELAQLHQQLAKSNVATNEVYDAIKKCTNNVIVNAYAKVGNTEYSKTPAADSTTTESKPVINQCSFTTNRANKEPFKVLSESKIRFLVPDHIDPNSFSDLAEYQDVGIKKEKMLSALKCAKLNRDIDFIITSLKCIRWENTDSTVEVLLESLKLLAILAVDEHINVDEEDSWISLCLDLIEVLSQNTAICSSALHTVLLDFPNQVKVFSQAEETIRNLINGRNEFETSEEIGGLESDLSSALLKFCISSLETFGMEESLGKAIVGICSSVCSLSIDLSDRLYQNGVIGKILDFLRSHQDNWDVVLVCMSALGKFQSNYLIEPRPNLRLSLGTSDRNSGSEVFSLIFEVVKNAFKKSQKLSAANESMYKEQQVLSACLFRLFDICESANIDRSLVEKLLYHCEPDTIISLVAITRAFPQDFRIQEGAIGILANIVSTGTKEIHEINTPDVVSDSLHGGLASDNFEAIPLKMTAEARLSLLLEQEKDLKLFLAAMERFSENEIVDGKMIGSTHSAKSSIISMRNSQSNSSGYKSIFVSSTPLASMSINQSAVFHHFREVDLQNNEDAAYEKGLAEVRLDSNGNHISAASLQKSVAIILGIACESFEAVQENLVRTRYNELIIRAFANFKDNPQLIQFGCYALFSTCRRHRKHQRLLYELHILKHLQIVLNNHDIWWNVWDGVLRALLGLLDPPRNLLEALSKKDKVNIADWDGYKVSEWITTTKSKQDENKKETLLDQITKSVVGFSMNPLESSYSLTETYFRLLNLLSFWNSALFIGWGKTYAAFQEDRFFNQHRNNFKKYIEGMFDGILYPEKKDRLNLLEEKDRFNLPEEKDCFNLPEEKDRLNLPEEKDCFNLPEEKDCLNLPEEKDHFNLPEEKDRFGRDSDEIFEENDKKDKETFHFSIESITSSEFNLNEKQPFVRAEALATLVSFITRTLNKNHPDFQFGDELPYSSDEGLRNCRAFIVESLFAGCLRFISNKYGEEENPKLLRYTLWLFFILISEPKQSCGATCIGSECFSASTISADLAVNGAIEWAIKLMTKYKNHYSLHCLATVFLIAMERYGRFGNRAECLLSLQTLLKANLTRKKESFLTLDEETQWGDEALVGKSVEFFGDLSVHSDRLLRLVEGHLPQIKATNMKVLWDGISRPVSILIASVETAEDGGFVQYSVYNICIQWEEDLDVKKGASTAHSNSKWFVSYRFADFYKFKGKIEKQYNFLKLSDIVLQRSDIRSVCNKLLQWRTSDFLENRRQKIQKWFDDLKSHPLIYFSEEFREFLGVKRPSLPRIRMIDKIVNPEVAPTTHIQYDIIHKIVIITTGVPTGLFNSKDQCRGSVAVYELSLKEEVLTIATAPSTIQRYNAAVTSACWNSYNRCLYVGLATGCILFYKLSVDNKSLNYVAELDYHRDAVRGIIVDNLSNRMISASRSGKIACFDTVDGVTVGQIPKIGLKITKVAYDPGNKLIFVGTNESSVLLYDVKVNPIIKTKTITTQNRIIAISGLVFLEEIRLLYVSCGNTVFIYRVSLDCKIEQYEEVSFHSNFIISDLAVIQGGKYVILLESLGTIMLLDMSSSVSHDTSEKVDELTTTVSAISSWQKVVQGDISAMRDWLRAVGLHGTNTVRSKKEILELISKVPKVDYESVISEMVKPRTAKKQILLYWKVKPSLSKALTSNLPFLRCCCFVEDNQVLLVGCNDGQIHLSSLSDFFAPYSVVDEMMISAEKRFIAENAHQEINGSKKSTRGLRHQLD